MSIAEVISDFAPQGMGQEELKGVLLWAIDPDLAEQLGVLGAKMTGVKFSGSILNPKRGARWFISRRSTSSLSRSSAAVRYDVTALGTTGE